MPRLSPAQLIRLDWMAAAFGAATILSLRGWLADLYAIPASVLLGIGIANLAYGCGSFTLFLLTRDGHVPYLRVLGAANMLWTVSCVALAVVWRAEATAFGLVHLLGEGLAVGVLGALEWRAAALKI
jgi:hypothetical protein